MSVELQRPVDGSDLPTLKEARDELLRLRQTLGHLAQDNGFAEVVYDGSDLIKGVDEEADYERCKAEVVHIRACLRLSTQNARRRARPDYAPTSFFDVADDEDEDEDEDDLSEAEDDAAEGEACLEQSADSTAELNVGTTERRS